MRYLMAGLCGLTLYACSGNSLAPSQQETFQVDSVPQGASVVVLGEPVGHTPMQLHRRDVFPQNFDHDKQHLYGRVELRHPDCNPYIKTVSSRVLSDGLKAELNCSAGPAAQSKRQPLFEQHKQASSVKQRLIRLKELFEEELISEQEYEAKRLQLLEEL